MTVSTTNNNVVYRGNGAATQFAVPFKVLDVDHLVVQRRVYATGALDHTYIGTEFTYSGLGGSSGTLTLNSPALSSTYEIVINRIVPYTQELDIVNAGGFYPETVEEQLDLIVMSTQQLADLVGRTPKAGVDDPGLVIPPASTLVGTNRALGTSGLTGQLALLETSAFKGDPGGNIMAIGLFSAAGGMTVPAGTTRVYTTGRTIDGKFPGVYIKYDAAWADATFNPADWPEICFTAADGRVFVFDYKGTDFYPGHFGVLGVSTTDDHAAMTRWCTFCCTFISRAFLDGACYLSQKLYFGLADGTDSKTMVYRGGRMDFRALPTVDDFEIDQLVHMRNMKDVSFEGRLRFFGGGSEVDYLTQDGTGYVDRLHVGCGLWLDDCRGAQFRYLYFNRFWYGGVVTQRRNLADTSNSNNNAVRFDKIEGQWIGSGDTDPHTELFDDPIQSLKAPFTCLASPSRDTGSASNVDQRSEITVTDLTKLPPANLHGATTHHLGTSLSNNPVIAFIDEQPHRVGSIDRTTGVVKLYPWVDPAVGTSGDVYFAWGGLIVIQGGDASLIELGMVDGRVIGVGMAVRTNQGPIVNMLLLENDCGIGVLIGDTIAGSDQGNGTSINGFYMEGPDNHLLIISDTTSSECSGFLYDTYTHDWTHLGEESYKTIHAPKDASYVSTDRAIWNWRIDVEGVQHLPKTHPGAGNFSIDSPQDVEIASLNSGTINLTNTGTLTQLMKYDRRVLVVRGGGANGAPTGTITFTVDSGGSLNGVTDGTLALSGFIGPLVVSLFESSNDVWTVGVISGKAQLSGSTTWDPGNLAAGANENKAVTVTGAVFGDGVVVSFDKDLQGMRLTGYVSAADTVTAALTNITGGAIDLASGTLTARIIR